MTTPAETAYFFSRSVLGHERQCIGFGSARHLVGSACLGPDNLISYYDLPATNVSASMYTSATMLSFSARIPKSVLHLPAKPVPVPARHA